MKIKCVVIDDEKSSINLLTNYIVKTNFLLLNESFTDSIKAFTFLKEYSNSIDLVFLDIKMPDIDGIEFLSHFSKSKIQFIISSASSDNAIHGYEFEVRDFLHKPYSYDRFLNAVSKVVKYKIPQLEDYSQTLFIPKKNQEIVSIQKSELYYIESLKDEVFMHCNEKIIPTTRSLKELEEKLVKLGFIRVHRSYIVAIDKIEKFNQNHIYLKNPFSNIKIPIGQNYKDIVRGFIS